MKECRYDTSYAILDKAVALAGEDSRRGGEFKLWAVQALQGVGRDEQAVELLKSMENHSDPDVRKVRAQQLMTGWVLHIRMDLRVLLSLVGGAFVRYS